MDKVNVFVAGSGMMGSGIAQVCATAGHKVFLWDIDEIMLANAKVKIEKSLQSRVEKGKLTEKDSSSIMDNIKAVPDLEEAAQAKLIIEAVPEHIDIKNRLFNKLDDICSDTSIFASNTSALSISDLANATNRADRFIGLHFFSPVPAMKLVEVVRGLKTSDFTMQFAVNFIEYIGKVGITVKDTPGFLINRIMHGFRQEVLACMEEGVATIADIDTAVKLGLGHPLGPFELNDFAGLDIGAATIQTLYEQFKDPKWRPNLTMKKLVAAGDLGRKTGKGWYDYTSGEQRVREDIHI